MLLPTPRIKVANIIWVILVIFLITTLVLCEKYLHNFQIVLSNFKQPIISPIPSASLEINSPISSPSNGTANSKDSLDSTPIPAVTQPLSKPYGSFVSNHMPSLSGAPGPAEESVCNTTIGASCSISFSKGITVKSLPSQKVDAAGAAYWNWSVKEIGLEQGEWKISAQSSLKNQTEIVSDNLNLKITQ